MEWLPVGVCGSEKSVVFVRKEKKRVQSEVWPAKEKRVRYFISKASWDERKSLFLKLKERF